MLGSEEEATELLNKIGSGTRLNFEDHTFKAVTNYYGWDGNVWKVRLMTIVSLPAIYLVHTYSYNDSNKLKLLTPL